MRVDRSLSKSFSSQYKQNHTMGEIKGADHVFPTSSIISLRLTSHDCPHLAGELLHPVLLVDLLPLREADFVLCFCLWVSRELGEQINDGKGRRAMHLSKIIIADIHQGGELNKTKKRTGLASDL